MGKTYSRAGPNDLQIVHIKLRLQSFLGKVRIATVALIAGTDGCH